MVHATYGQNILRIGRTGDVLPRVVTLIAGTDTHDDALVHGNVGSNGCTTGFTIQIFVFV